MSTLLSKEFYCNHNWISVETNKSRRVWVYEWVVGDKTITFVYVPFSTKSPVLSWNTGSIRRTQTKYNRISISANLWKCHKFSSNYAAPTHIYVVVYFVLINNAADRWIMMLYSNNGHIGVCQLQLSSANVDK